MGGLSWVTRSFNLGQRDFGFSGLFLRGVAFVSIPLTRKGHRSFRVSPVALASKFGIAKPQLGPGSDDWVHFFWGNAKWRVEHQAYRRGPA